MPPKVREGRIYTYTAQAWVRRSIFVGFSRVGWTLRPPRRGAADGGSVLLEKNQRKIDLRTPAGTVYMYIFPSPTRARKDLQGSRRSEVTAALASGLAVCHYELPRKTGPYFADGQTIERRAQGPYGSERNHTLWPSYA